MIATAIGIGVLSVTVAACGGSSGGDSSEEGDHTITFVSAGVSQPAFIPLECGIVETAKKLGVGLETTGAQQQTGPATAQVLRSLQAKSPEGMIVDSNDATAAAVPLEQLSSGGSTVVEVDSFSESEQTESRVGLNNVEMGEIGAKALAEQMGGKGTMLVMSYEPGYTTLEQRTEGIENELEKEFPEVELLPVQYFSGSADKAASILKATKVRYPDLGGVISLGNLPGETTGGIFENNPSLMGETKALTLDVTPRLVELLEGGSMTALVNGNFYEQGVRSTETLVKLLEGEEVPEKVYVPTVVVTKEDLDDPKIEVEVEKALSGKC